MPHNTITILFLALQLIIGMPPGPRDYKPAEIKRLSILSNNECACPTCTNALVARDGRTVIGKISHIEAASPGGPRYRAEMSDDERRSFENLMLLCDECHSIIDNAENENDYPVELLKEWKRDHESKNQSSSWKVTDEIVKSFIDNSQTVVNTGFVSAQLNLQQSEIQEVKITSTQEVTINNNYVDIHSEEEDAEAIKAIFDNALALMNADDFERAETDATSLTHTLEKIQLNFRTSSDVEEVRAYFTNAFDKKMAIERHLRSLEPENQEDLQNHILSKYAELKDSNSSIEVLRKLFTFFVPRGKEQNPTYDNLAKGYVLLFFEDCTIFLKTASEKAKVHDLFSDL